MSPAMAWLADRVRFGRDEPAIWLDAAWSSDTLPLPRFDDLVAGLAGALSARVMRCFTSSRICFHGSLAWFDAGWSDL